MKTTTSQKMSLAILALAVVALLAPYSGCNGVHSGPEPTFEEPELSALPPRLKTTRSAPNPEEPIDPIEEILSN